MSLKTVIIDDEEIDVLNLESNLNKYCPGVEIIGTCLSEIEAARTITEKRPDLVFLNAHLGQDNGFDILARVQHIPFHLIITADHYKFGFQAIRANAIGYLRRPYNQKDLQESVRKVIRMQSDFMMKSNRIAVPVTDGYKFVSYEEILYVNGSNQRSIFHLFNGQQIDSPRVLKRIDYSLKTYGFYRIHKRHLVNLQYVENYSRTDGGYVIMSNGERLPVSQKFTPPNIISL
ncbi:MAG: LytTR family DNA-binding domain-containing protein [Bacteroidota bacterium]